MRDWGDKKTIVFTGTSKLKDPRWHAWIVHRLLSLYEVERFVSGGAYGVDTVAGVNAALMYPNAEHVLVHPAEQRWNRSLRQLPIWTDIVQAHGGYRGRNEMMVKIAAQARNEERIGQLVAFPPGPEKSYPRSGTWMTVRIAENLDVPVFIDKLWERFPREEPK